MNAIDYERGCWPTRQQELLLQAALLQGKDAIAAWHAWKSDVDIDRLDQGSRGLLPLLYRNLCVHGVETSLMGRFKGVYRLTWYKNQVLFHDMATLLRSFHNAGIQTLILEGAALTLLHYKDYGLRPMNDFDVLVHTEQASATINLLTKLDWKPKQRPLGAFTETYFSLGHSHGFKDAAGRGFDLHWHVLPECCYASAGDDFWDGAVLTKIHDVSTYALSPTDQLLHVCVHGARWGSVLPLHWVADAMIIMRTLQSEMDWNRLVTQAEKHRLIVPLKYMLKYLQDAFDAPIPPAVLQHIQTIPTSKREQIEYKFKTHRVGLWGRLSVLWFDYLRQAGNINSLQKLVGFSRFLQYTWGVDYLWQLPFYAFFKGMRRMWKTAVPDLNSPL